MTMGSMDINSTCDDGKVLLYYLCIKLNIDNNIIELIFNNNNSVLSKTLIRHSQWFGTM